MSLLSSWISKLPGGNVINSIGQSAINVAVSAVPYGSTINRVAQGVGNSIFNSATRAGAEQASESFLELATRAQTYAGANSQPPPASSDNSQLLTLAVLGGLAVIALKD